jgi:tetratricopeptide (TPR) repeat protein
LFFDELWDRFERFDPVNFGSQAIEARQAALESQGKYNEAEPIYRETLALREKVYGKEHPDTFGSMNNLARLLESQGKYDEAQQLFVARASQPL